VAHALQLATGNERRAATLRDAVEQCRASALQGVVQERLLRAQLQHVRRQSPRAAAHVHAEANARTRP
jgi:predicted metal-dependent phosphoesterase TrpH